MKISTTLRHAELGENTPFYHRFYEFHLTDTGDLEQYRRLFLILLNFILFFNL